jgi:hypothetical protein
MPPDTEEQPQDLRSMLSRAVDESETPAAATETPERPERQVRDTAALAESGGAEPAVSVADDRPRGPDGKFVPKEGTQEGKPDDLAAETAHETGADEGAPPAPVETAPDVPAHWSQSDKDMIAGLPKEHQGKVVERYKAIEAGYAPKLQRAAQIEQEYRGAMEIFEPHMRGLRQAGKTPSDIIRGWHSIEQDMIQGREYAARGGVNDMGAQHVARMIAAYNIDPGRVAALLRGEQPEGNMGAAAQPPAAIPQQFLQAFNSLEQRLNQREAADQAAKEAAVNSQMDVFINEKDETGQLKHPYFSELERDMTMLAQTMLSQGMQPTIADLYQRAVYANPETRSKLLAANQAQEQRKAAAERKAQAVAATRAASSVNGSPGTGGSPAERRGARSLREQIAEAAAELEAG